MGQEIPEQPDSVEVEGTTVKKTGKTTSYKVSRNDKNIIECTCPSFQVYKTPFKGAGKVRTCKHIKELRGEDAENHRLNVQFNELHMELYGKNWDGILATKVAFKPKGRKAHEAEEDEDEPVTTTKKSKKEAEAVDPGPPAKARGKAIEEDEDEPATTTRKSKKEAEAVDPGPPAKARGKAQGKAKA